MIRLSSPVPTVFDNVRRHSTRLDISKPSSTVTPRDRQETDEVAFVPRADSIRHCSTSFDTARQYPTSFQPHPLRCPQGEGKDIRQAHGALYPRERKNMTYLLKTDLRLFGGENAGDGGTIPAASGTTGETQSVPGNARRGDTGEAAGDGGTTPPSPAATPPLTQGRQRGMEEV